MLSDDKLIDQIKYGNERAAEELITRYYATILRYCRWIALAWKKLRI